MLAEILPRCTLSPPVVLAYSLISGAIGVLLLSTDSHSSF
jgi:hypothetical protein